MIEINKSRFKSPPPLKHQLDGIRALVRHPEFALFDAPRTMKSRQCIDAACLLNEGEIVNTVVIVAPAQVRAVWADAVLGEIKEWAWRPSAVQEFALGKYKTIWHDENPKLLFFVTNYEIMRNHVDRFIETIRGAKAMLILDESDLVKNRAAKQTKAIMKLRQHCSRCVLLTATPGTILDQWSQLEILSPKILKNSFGNYFSLRARYCTLQTDYGRGGRFTKVVGFKNIEDFSKRTAPYVLCRKKEDVLDLPPRVFSIREVQLSKETWKRYRELKREAIISLGDARDLRLEPNAAVRIMRLSQICGGILGGFQPDNEGGETQDLSSEKLDWCVEYLTRDLHACSTIVWCRFRRERERLSESLRVKGIVVHEIYGGQKKSEREEAKKIFHARSEKVSSRTVLVGQPGAGGVGIDMAQASEVIRLSNDYSLRTLVQSDDRPYGPAQTQSIEYIDVLAVGPDSQPTIDHLIVKALREKQSVAEWTTSRWRKALEEE